MIVVADSSPLILLARIGQLPLLRSLYGTVDVPFAVYRETVLQDAGRPGAAEIGDADWIRVQKVTDLLAARMLRQQIGPGESEAIVLALEMQAALLLIDDAKGRRVAESYGISAAGTIGILIQAKRRGILHTVKPSLNAIREAGLRMNEGLYNHALRICDEESKD